MKLAADNVVQYATTSGLVSSSDFPCEVEPLAGGVSCSVFRLWPATMPPIVIKQALAQLRVEKEWLADPARSHHEAILLRLLNPVLGDNHVPRLLLDDEHEHIIAMTSAAPEATNWKQDMLDRNRFDKSVAATCGSLLGRIQEIPLDSAVPQTLYDKTFFRQLRVDAYVLHVANQFPALEPLLSELAEDLMTAKSCITHADFTPKNILVGKEGPVILDFEVAHVGHPAFDPASIVNHLFLKSRAMPRFSSDLLDLAHAFLSSYLQELRDHALPRKFWIVLGALALARVHGKSLAEYITNTDMKAVITDKGSALVREEIRSLDALWS
jgi:5-methylthioribose kinase